MRRKAFPDGKALVASNMQLKRGKTMKLEDISYKIRGAIFEVNKELGGGFLEKVYENSLVMELRSVGLKVASQVPLTVRYKGSVVGEYIAD